MKPASRNVVFAFGAAAVLAMGCASSTDPVSMVDHDAASYARAGSYIPNYKEYDWRDGQRSGRPVTTYTWTPVGLTKPRGLVLISHGSLSTGKLHKFLGEHLASRGYVVFAPDHYGNSLGDKQLDDVYEHRVRDLQFLIGQSAGNPTWEAARDAGVAAIGHSIGGYDALALCGAAIDDAEAVTACGSGDQLYCRLHEAQRRWSKFSDARVATCIGLTPFVHPIYGEKGGGAANLNRPVLLVGADEDSFLLLEPYLRHFFEASPQPDTRLLTIKGAGHLSFTDVMNEGSLDHPTIKAITDAYVTAWLEWRLHSDAAAGRQFSMGAPETGSYGAHVLLK